MLGLTESRIGGRRAIGVTVEDLPRRRCKLRRSVSLYRMPFLDTNNAIKQRRIKDDGLLDAVSAGGA